MAINKSIMWLVLIMVGVMIMSMAVLVSADPLPPAPVDDLEFIRCFGVWRQLSLCIDNVMDAGHVPSATCCSAARLIYKAPDLQLKCSCLQYYWIRNFVIAPMLTNYVSLPGKCRFKVPVQITPNTNCSRIQES